MKLLILTTKVESKRCKLLLWQAAHTLGVVGMEHLPVPAPPAPYRPNMSKDHLQIADESELRGEQGSMASLYNSIQTPTSQYQASFKLFFGSQGYQ